ncbi:MAG: class I SAM-dependent methyltransferase [Caldilineaceae bacterium]|nr:class I SAM-dependent methyltransferase [Caldilineaceae bacterium]
MQPIGAQHEFHDPVYAQDWANRFVPTRPRQALFDLMVEQITSRCPGNAHIVELGIGPGYLAWEILGRIPGVSYEGVDFSEAMFAIARARLAAFAGRIVYTRADLTDGVWSARLSRQPDAIVSTWALHDLGAEAHIAAVYGQARAVLPTGGLLLNGDFVKPDESNFDYEPGRITPSRHEELLRAAGFGDVQQLAYWEKDVDNPTSANNYACFVGIA